MYTLTAFCQRIVELRCHATYFSNAPRTVYFMGQLGRAVFMHYNFLCYSIVDKWFLDIAFSEYLHMSPDMTKPTKWVCSQRRQICLGIRPVWSESSLCAHWVAKDPRFLHVDSEDSDQTGRMPRLIWIFPGRAHSHFVGFVMRRLMLNLHSPHKQ